MSIRKRGKAWEIVIEMGKDADGKRKQETFTFHGTKADAKEEEIRIKYELQHGTFIPNTKTTLTEYLNYWLDANKPPYKWTHNTYRSYRQLVEDYITPELGHLPFLKVTPLQVQEFYNKLVESSDNNLENSSIHYIHRILRSAFNYARKKRLIRDNPCYGAEPPSPNKYTPTLLRDAQIMKLWAYLRPDPIYFAVVLSVMTGVRRGEACGLQRDTIFRPLHYIKIIHALKREKGEGLKLGPTKAKNDGIVPISDLLDMELEYQEQKIAEWKEVYSDDFHDQGYIVCWPNGNPIDPDYVTKQFNKALETLGLPKETRFHDLRHAHATFLLDLGADITDIKDELRHSSVAVSEIYVNPNVSRRKKFVDKLDQQLINSATENQET